MDFSSYWWPVLFLILSGLGSIAINLISAYLKPVTDALLDQFSSTYTVKTLSRRIRENRQLKKHIEELVNSKTALLAMGLHRMFVVLAIFSVVFAAQNILELLTSSPAPTWVKTVRVVLWLLPAAVATDVVRTVQRVVDYPRSIEELDKRTAKLLKRLDKLNNKERDDG